MKLIAPLLMSLILFPILASAQVKVSPMKVIYIRQGENVPDFKKRVEIRYPKIDEARNETVRRRIEASLNYWKVFGDGSLEEDIGEYYWLSSLDYEVGYNKNGILDVRLMREGSGAYPSTYFKHVVIDTRNGRGIKIPRAFRNIGGLLVEIEKAQKKELNDHVIELRNDNPENADTFKEMMAEGEYGIDTLDEFTVTDTGVTFIFDYGFPHVIKALQPDGRYFFSWDEIGLYVRPNGPLAGFLNR